ncbi:MAG: universal stress protein [Terriglobales bacterium]
MQALDVRQPVQFQNVLLATDFSPASETALLYSLALARRWKARVFVVHVVNPATIFGADAVQRAVNDAWRQAHTVMTDQLIAGRLEGIENHVVVRQGDVWPELARMIEEFHVDLLVTGTRGRTGVWKMLLGSTAETIFRRAPCPVLTVGPKSPDVAPQSGPKRILYSTGFAPHSLYAGIFALSLAQQNRARLALLNVIKEVQNDNPQKRQELEREAKQHLQELIPPEANLAETPEVFVAFGSAADAILRLANEWKPELIVLGVRRPHPEARRITWATAYNVVSNAPCPVLTVKQPES